MTGTARIGLLSATLLLTGWAATGAGHAGDLRATDIARAAGLGQTVNDTYGNNVVFDFNRDGLSDLMLGRHNLGPAELFRGNANHTFNLVQTFPLADRHFCDSGDFNRDGRPDLYCSVGAEHGASNSKSNELWLQNAAGRFRKAPGAWGAGDPSGRGRDVAVFDANRDGRPDVFVGNGVPQSFDSPNRLFLNRPGRGFVASSRLGEDPGTSGLCVSHADFNRDGWQDMYVCGTYDSDRLFVRHRGAGYTEKLTALGLPPSKSRDAQWGDVNNDGRLDLLRVTDTSAQLWLYNGQRFRPGYRTSLRAGRNAQFLDADQDGDLDIYLVQGHSVGSTVNEPDRLMLNAGNGTSFTSFRGLPQARVGGGNEVSLVPNFNHRPALIVSNGGDGGPQWRGPRQLIVFD